MVPQHQLFRDKVRFLDVTRQKKGYTSSMSQTRVDPAMDPGVRDRSGCMRCFGPVTSIDPNLNLSMG